MTHEDAQGRLPAFDAEISPRWLSGVTEIIEVAVAREVNEKVNPALPSSPDSAN